MQYVATSFEILLDLQEQQTKESSSKPRYCDPSTSSLSANSLDETRPLEEAHEEMLVKLEGDIRNHIRLEQQMKLHIENL